MFDSSSTYVYQSDFSLKLVKKYERGDIPKSDWLDKLAFRQMEEVHAVRANLCADPLFALNETVHYVYAGRGEEIREFLPVHRPTTIRLSRRLQ